MSAIITITFNPCIDKSTYVKKMVAEKKMICAVPKLEPGGGGVNVARAIKKLGGEATAIFPSGGYTGKWFNHLIKKENIPCIIIETECETRENIIILDESSNKQYRFGMPAAKINENEWKACLEEVERMNDVEFLVVSGSLPPGISLDVYSQISKISKKKNAKLIVDVFGEALRQVADSGAYLIKPNLDELCSLTEIENIDLKNVEEITKEYILGKGSKIKIIVVSLGKEGALLVTKDESYRISAPEVLCKSTVGAGDSMMAGIIYSLFQKMSLRNALEYGVACGSAATINPGSELCNLKDVEQLFKRIKNDQTNQVM